MGYTNHFTFVRAPQAAEATTTKVGKKKQAKISMNYKKLSRASISIYNDWGSQTQIEFTVAHKFFAMGLCQEPMGRIGAREEAGISAPRLCKCEGNAGDAGLLSLQCRHNTLPTSQPFLQKEHWS